MTNSSINGTLWIYDYGNDNSLQPVELVGFPTTRTFHPLGLDVVPATASEPAYAFVVNLETNTGAVEVFTISDKAPYKAFYTRTLEHPLTHAPNALVAISSTQLYVSIDHRFTARMPKWKGILSLVEDVLQAPLAWVTYIEILPDGTVNYSKAANFINFANGVFLSRDGKEFAVVSSARAILSFYDRDPATSKLAFREKIALPHPPDNLHPDSDGNIVVSGSANLLQLMEFASGTRTNSPSWITRITRRKPYPKGTVLPPDDMAAPFDKTSDRIPQNPKYEFTTMYYGDGTQFPSTSAAIIDGQELIGMTLLGRGILHCE
ncbi:hypothetical protein BS47DRAFT_1310448 [Hydnum rufescens UP504]|uniref:Uncharacterized protein n=1 Tax=Hydnum rufescens UP504 TaxID=1448309 RepID=A0A9P6ABA4_9AGAM|nr:hypothetical protein BS47DRAFT_1310448 [Hydnum rufescens UP504]